MAKDEEVALFPLDLERGMTHPAEVGHWQTPECMEGFQICVNKCWRAASSSGSCLNGIIQGSCLSRKTYTSGDPLKGSPDTTLRTAGL